MYPTVIVSFSERSRGSSRADYFSQMVEEAKKIATERHTVVIVKGVFFVSDIDNAIIYHNLEPISQEYRSKNKFWAIFLIDPETKSTPET